MLEAYISFLVSFMVFPGFHWSKIYSIRGFHWKLKPRFVGDVSARGHSSQVSPALTKKKKKKKKGGKRGKKGSKNARKGKKSRKNAKKVRKWYKKEWEKMAQ